MNSTYKCNVCSVPLNPTDKPQLYECPNCKAKHRSYEMPPLNVERRADGRSKECKWTLGDHWNKKDS